MPIETRTWFSIYSDPIRADEAFQVVTDEYPGFRDAPIECVFCEDPAPNAANFARPAKRALVSDFFR